MCLNEVLCIHIMVVKLGAPVGFLTVCVCVGGEVVSLLPVVGTFILLMGCLMQNWYYSLF